MTNDKLTVEYQRHFPHYYPKWMFFVTLSPDSLLIIFSADAAIIDGAAAVVAPFGWRNSEEFRPHIVCEMISSAHPAVVLIDGAACDPGSLIADIRRLPPPASGTPILLVRCDPGLSPGPGGHVDLPLDGESLATMVARWAGPLADHQLRAAPYCPEYRLTRLLGHDAALAMLTRFRQDLEETLLTAGDAPDGVRAHRIAGLAGLMGFEQLSRLWADAHHHGADALGPAIEASRILLAGDALPRVNSSAPPPR